ncbi:LOW QUALITY PROTEIN: protein eva-1 homolog A [Hipposideros larvatus]
MCSHHSLCVPKQKRRGRGPTDPAPASPGGAPDATWRPSFCHSTVSEPVREPAEMALLSNILAAYSFVSENPERAALYFVSGVCIGLVLTLAALVMRISCHTDCRRRPRKKYLQDQDSSSDSSDSEDGSSDTASDISVRRHRRFERSLNKNVFTSAEELERAQRLEERERIIREIWMNGQPEVPGTRSLNRYY